MLTLLQRMPKMELSYRRYNFRDDETSEGGAVFFRGVSNVLYGIFRVTR